jgi:hypothetical protein
MVLLSMIIPQIHFSGFCVPIWTALVIISGRQWLNAAMLRRIGFFFVIGLATWLPWIHWQHYSNHWQDFTQFVNAVKGASPFSLTKLWLYYGHLASSLGLEYWFRTPVQELPAYFPRGISVLGWIIGAVHWLLLVLAIFRYTGNAIGRLLVSWSVLPMVMLLVIRPNVHPHYEFIAFPVPWMLMAGLAVGLGRLVTGMFLLWSILASVQFLGVLAGWHRYIAQGQLDGDDRYQLSYRQRREALESVLEDSGAVVREIAGPFSGQQPAYMFQYGHEVWWRSQGRWPHERDIRYWMDELKGPELSPTALADLSKYPPFVQNPHVEKMWTVGPTRIFRIRGRPAE